MFVRYQYTTWTTDLVCHALMTDDKFAANAIVALVARQTEIEKLALVTTDLNDRGLQQADAKDFTILAIKVRRGESLSDVDLAHVRRLWHRSKTPKPTICKYRHQILDMIEAKAKANGAELRPIKGQR